jgi:hypothetical protein
MLKEPARVIVAGGRKFADYKLLARTLDRLIGRVCKRDEVEIVSGKAPGADQLGEKWARKNRYRVKEFPADWDSMPTAAGRTRNQEMANYSTHLIAFWDGESPGTRDMISRAKQRGLKVKVIRYD